MAMFFLVVATLNLVLGYALAIHLIQVRDEAPPLAGSPLPAPDPTPAAMPSAAPRAELAAEALASAAPSMPPPATAVTEPAVLEPAPAVPVAQEISAIALPAIEITVSPSVTAGAASASPAEVESSIEEFKHELARYRDRLATLDDKMRSCPDPSDPVAMKECLHELQDANANYLSQQSDAAGRFQIRCQPENELAPIARRVEKAVEAQTQQVRNTTDQLAEFGLETNLLVDCQQLLDETSRLVEANHTLRDELQDARIELSRQKGWQGASGGPPADPVNNLSSRAQLEAALSDWWQGNPNGERPMAAAMIDVDRFRQINETQGVQTSERLLSALGQIIGRSTRGDDRAAQYSGQRYLLMFPGTIGRDSTNAIERVRQQVEATRFQRGDDEIVVTVSCAVVDAAATDTTASLLERVEQTLEEAKRYGRNRTFLHDGKVSAPVVPPQFAISGQVVTI